MIKISMTRTIVWLTQRVVRNPRLTIIFVGLVTIFFAAGLSNLRVDVTNDALFSSEDPAQIAYRNFQRDFGRDDIVVLAVSSDKIFTGEFMATLRNMHREIERNVPWLEDVTSIVNADYAYMSNESLHVGNLGDRWPKTGPTSSEFQKEILSSPLYGGTLLSKDGKMTLIAIRALAFSPKGATLNQSANADKQTNSDAGFFTKIKNHIIEWHDDLNAKLGVKPRSQHPVIQPGDSAPADPGFKTDTVDGFSFDKKDVKEDSVGLNGVQLKQFLQEVNRISDNYRAKGLDIKLSGGTVIDDAHQAAIHSDALLMVGLAFIIVTIALSLQMRSKLGVIFPLLITFASLISTLGMMGWLGIPISVVSQALPPIMLTLGVMASVHLMSRYFQEDAENIDDAIKNVFEHSGTLIVYTLLTDAAAFISFTVARMQPIAEFGWMAAFGSIILLLYTLLLLPALLKIFPPIKQKAARKKFMDSLAKLMLPVADMSVRYPWRVMAGVLLLSLLALPGLSRTTFAHDVLSWFPQSHPVRVDTMSIDEKMQATVPLEVVLDTGKENGILDPEFMAKLQALREYCRQLSGSSIKVGNATSVVDSLERIHYVLEGNQPVTKLPKNERLLNQEFILYEGGGAKEIERLIDRRYSKARMTIRLAWTDGHNYAPLHNKIRDKANELFGEKVKITVTGAAYLTSVGAIDVIDSMWSSYLIAVGLIGLMLVVVLKNLRVAIASLIPNFMPIFLGISAMGYLGIPIDMFTVLLGGIALGVSVDDTVHFMHTVLRHRKKGLGSIRDAVHVTLKEVGPATAINSLVLASGFFVFSLSSIGPLSLFGIILGAIILLAFLFDVIISPAIITIVDRMSHNKEVINTRIVEIEK